MQQETGAFKVCPSISPYYSNNTTQKNPTIEGWDDFGGGATVIRGPHYEIRLHYQATGLIFQLSALL